MDQCFLCLFFLLFFCLFFFSAGFVVPELCPFYIPRHTLVAGYYGFTLDIHVSVPVSVFRFRMIT